MSSRTLQDLVMVLFGITTAILVLGLRYPEALISFKVVDQANLPIADAEVGVGFQVQSATHFGNEEVAVRGKTNKDGRVSVSARGERHIGFSVRKPGFYRTTGRYSFESEQGDRWGPWNPLIPVLLKKIGSPIPMFAKRVDLVLPASSGFVGYDLIKGDWTPPYGSGSVADLKFTPHLEQKSRLDFSYALEVSFSNPKDGLQSFEVPQFSGSLLRSSREAPDNGYIEQWRQFRTRVPGKPEESNYDENRNYFLRVRTEVDEKGTIVSALYGKIYGDFLRFTYYLNPTPNDRNIEFDPARNLFNDLPRDQRPTAP